MSVPDQNTQAQQEQKPNDKEYNFAQLRKQLDQEKQARLAERQEYEQRLSRIEQERQSAPRQDDHDDDSDEPYVDKKALKRHLSSFERNLDQKIDRKAEEKARQLVEQERQSSFLRQNADFNQILTPDLILKFAETHPEIAEPMLEMPDNFARQKLLYQNIKALGLHKPPEPQKPIQETIDKNRRSPYYQPSGIAAPPNGMQGDFSASGQKNAYDKMKQLINSRRALS